MATIALDSVSDEVLARLRRLAERDGSDLADEVLKCLEKGLSERERVEADLEELRSLRGQMKGAWVTNEMIRAARDEGRA
jgi:hypothetical protein